jgi:hypothetical protein
LDYGCGSRILNAYYEERADLQLPVRCIDYAVRLVNLLNQISGGTGAAIEPKVLGGDSLALAS